MNSPGSIWQKWDLHVHTPASYHWMGQRFEGQRPAQQDALCKAVLDAMNDADVVAFCIMDYWTFDGFIKLRDYANRTPAAAKKMIFPGIELRMAAPTIHRLNTHVLLSDEVSNDGLTHFISHLKSAELDGKPPTREHLIEVGRSLDPGKLRTIYGLSPEDRSNEPKMLEIGLKTAEVTRESVVEAIDVVGRERCLVIQPYDTNDGLDELDWKCHPYTDSYLMKWADCFEAKDPVHVDLFLGRGIKSKPHVGEEFLENLGGYPKPVFRGSDAHKVSMYGVYPNNRMTWLKAQPTFKGLKQVCHEPSLRCHIGDRPEKLVHVENNPTRYMTSLKLTKVPGSSLTDEHWFHDKAVELNPGLIAIIGNKGSGKSALADILALTANSYCSELEFLNEDRFRLDNKAAQFSATLTWADNKQVTVNLNDKCDRNQPERIRYLPQHFIENLCNEIAQGNDTEFKRELRKVIFKHIPEEDQLKKDSLDELLDYLVQARKIAFAQEQQSIFALNDVILRKEQEMSAESIDAYEKALALKKVELEALEKTPLEEVKEPTEDPNDEATKAFIEQIEQKTAALQELLSKLNDAKEERQALVAERAALNRLTGHIDNIARSHQKFVADHSEEFKNAGFNITDIVSVTITRKPIDDRISETTTRLAELSLLLDGSPATDTEPELKGLQTQATVCAGAITKLQDGLNAPQKAYQAYLKALAYRNQRRALIVGSSEKPETIEYYKDRIKRAKEIIPDELTRLRNERRSIVRKLHAELLAMRNDYIKLYAAVQTIATDAAKSAHSIQLEFDASVTVSPSFDTDFLDFIHRRRTGNFQGDDDSKTEVKSLLKLHEFNDTDSVVSFTDAVIDKLTMLERDGEVQQLSIANQLRDKTKVKPLYDFIFGLGYLDIRYNLRLGGKDISQLSPGEKGALLLVFYLLLDSEEIPIIIDQPEHNLDNESVVLLLVDCIRKARTRRQVIIVTHNPNLAVYCDADQIICCSIDKTDGHKIDYSTGAIEDYDINRVAVNVLEGTYPAFENRRKKWHKPVPRFAAPGIAPKAFPAPPSAS